MNDTEDLVSVRREVTSPVRPGVHSWNSNRLSSDPKRSPFVRALLALLVIAGIAGVGYYGYSLADQYIYQAYENWAFDQQISGQRKVDFSDYVRERTPFGFLVGDRKAIPIPQTKTPLPSGLPRLAEGDLLGRVGIPRLNLSAIVREGVDQHTLSLAVGHVPSTALPGQPGNFAIAAHRDTLFRALKDIRHDDLITFQSPDGVYSYRVEATKIVKPSDVSVLSPDGGGLVGRDNSDLSRGAPKLLTMVTCYPFYYVGSAPKRFIVQARLVSNEDKPGIAVPVVVPIDSGSTFVSVPVPVHSSNGRSIHSSSPAVGDRSSRFSGWDQSSTKPRKKPGFWHRVFRAH